MHFAHLYPIIAFDTEFPGIAIQNKYTDDLNDFDLIRDNVNQLKLI